LNANDHLHTSKETYPFAIHISWKFVVDIAMVFIYSAYSSLLQHYFDLLHKCFPRELFIKFSPQIMVVPFPYKTLLDANLDAFIQ